MIGIKLVLNDGLALRFHTILIRYGDCDFLLFVEGRLRVDAIGREYYHLHAHLVGSQWIIVVGSTSGQRAGIGDTPLQVVGHCPCGCTTVVFSKKIFKCKLNGCH